MLTPLLFECVCASKVKSAKLECVCMCEQYCKCAHTVEFTETVTEQIPQMHCVLRTPVLATENKDVLISSPPLSSPLLSFSDIDRAERFEYKELRPERRNSRDFREVMKV